MQSHANSLARIESDWTLRDGVNSLISNISCTKQPPIVNQQCVVCKFQCDLCDASYVGYTLRHLHQRVNERKNQSSSIGKH